MKVNRKRIKNNYFPLILELGMVFTFLGNKHPPGSINLPGVNRATRRRNERMSRKLKKGKKQKDLTSAVKGIKKTTVSAIKRITTPWILRQIKKIIKYLRKKLWIKTK